MGAISNSLKKINNNLKVTVKENRGIIFKAFFFLNLMAHFPLIAQKDSKSFMSSSNENDLTIITRKEMPFEKYNFKRTKYHHKAQEYLMGNGEMGGWASNDGLGFKKLWFADVWQNETARQSLDGPKLNISDCDMSDQSVIHYSSQLNIKNGILETSLSHEDGIKYSSTIFFSTINKHVLVINVKNESNKKSINFNLSLPFKNYQLNLSNSFTLTAKPKDIVQFTNAAWSLKSSLPIVKTDNNYQITLGPNDEVNLKYSVVTQFDQKDYVAESIKSISHFNSPIKILIESQKKAWNEHWKRIGSVILPDGDNAKWFYRSIYTLYATSGSQKFLPGELQFSIPDSDWKMHPFTYGYAGWAIWCYTILGDKDAAKQMAKWHYKPKALKENVKILFPETGAVEVIYKDKNKGRHTYLDTYNTNAIAFGHEITTEGYNINYPTGSWDLQRQLDAFASSFFCAISQYYSDDKFTKEYTYPVLKGTAELWSSLVKWDSLKKHYYLPPLLSVSENIMEKSVLDAVLAARWNLKMASVYADKLRIDDSLKEKWSYIYKYLYIPQNDSIYLEYLNDKQTRPGGGYFGIRAYTYFGFPVMETLGDINPEKARRSLDRSWKRNDNGEGMITFIMNWFSLTESYLGFGNKAYEISNLTTTVKDPSGVALYEYNEKQPDGTLKGHNPYFLTGYSSFILSQIAMLLQNYNNSIKVFPALPDHWKDVEFYNLPAHGNRKVSAVIKSGKIKQIIVKKDSEIKTYNPQQIPVTISIKD